MNELSKTTNAIVNCDAKDITPQLMTMCRAITPQFYKGMSDMDIKAEKLGIDLLTANIDQKCLGEMCRLAVMNYPKFRSENPKCYFDVNYILTFFKRAFNKLYCESIELPKKSNRIECFYDEDTGILTEVWETPDKQKITIKEIREYPNRSGHIYSSKFNESLFNNWEDIDI